MAPEPVILYVGSLRNGSTARARMLALERLGCRLEPFDIGPYANSGSWHERQLLSRYSRGSAVRRLNEDLLATWRAWGRPIDYVWIDKGLWITPDTLRTLQHGSDAKLVHYTPDPQIVFQPQKLRNFVACIPLYDLLFTTKPFELAGYRRLGARDVRLVHQSYDDQRLMPRAAYEIDGRLRSQVCFIGQYTPHYARLLHAAVRTGVQVRLWGPNWRRRFWRHPWAISVLAGDGLWGEEYGRALAAADIALCFLSKRYPETTTTRTFEIPACGTFMLAERTEDHLALFDEGREAEFFGDEAELAAKIRFYLAHPVARARIAAAGYARCLRSGYSDLARMRELLSMAGLRASLPLAREA